METRGEVAKRRRHTDPCQPLTPQGALALALPVGPGVVQSLAYHPMEPCLLTAIGGSIQC